MHYLISYRDKSYVISIDLIFLRLHVHSCARKRETMYFLMFFPDTKEVEIKYPKIQLKPWLMIIISYEGLLNQKRIIK